MAKRQVWTRRDALTAMLVSGAAPLMVGSAAAQNQPPAPSPPASPPPAPAGAPAPDAANSRYQVDTLTLATPRKPMRVTFTRLKFQIRRPIVIVLPEKVGPAANFDAIAQRMAQEGLLAAMPDLPSAWGVGPDGPQELRDAYNKAPISDQGALIELLAEHLGRFPEGNGSVGLLAFQWGAQAALSLLQKAGRLKAAVLFDVVMDRPERWQGVTAPMQMHIPDQDQAVFGGADNIEKKFLTQGRLYEQYFYPGMSAGFALDNGSKRYNKAAADLAFDRAAKYLKRKLQF
jgi:dienelactone hydrolase